MNAIYKVQARETYLRCFDSIYSYLSSSMSNEQLQLSLVVLGLMKQDTNEYIQLFQFILNKLNPTYQQIIPTFFDDPQPPSFINSHSWALCSTDEMNRKYPDLNQNLIDCEHEWKEYLFSTLKLDFINKSPYEKTRTINIIDRFILSIILRPEKVCLINLVVLNYNRIDLDD